jgi:hypothetical protein
MMFMVTDIRTKATYIFERSRKGSSKLLSSVMPADLPVVDSFVPFRNVPLYIRRAARAAFKEAAT